MKIKNKLVAIFMIVVVAVFAASCTAGDKTTKDSTSTLNQSVDAQQIKDSKNFEENSANVSNDHEIIQFDDQNAIDSVRPNAEVLTTSKRDLEDLPDDIKNDVSATQAIKATTSKKAQKSTKYNTTVINSTTTSTTQPTTKTTTVKNKNPYEAPAVPIN